MFNEKYEYADLISVEDELSTDEEEQLDADVRRTSRKRSTEDMCFAGIGIFLALCVFALWLMISATSASSLNRSTCGDDPETARRNNCSFDLISFAWQRPECYDAELVGEFAAWNEWAFFAHRNMTEPVSQEEAFHGNRTLYVEWAYHKVHCTFIWRQMHRQYERGWVDSHLGNYNHTLHCQHVLLLDDPENFPPATQANVIYPECNQPSAMRYSSGYFASSG